MHKGTSVAVCSIFTFQKVGSVAGDEVLKCQKKGK